MKSVLKFVARPTVFLLIACVLLLPWIDLTSWSLPLVLLFGFAQNLTYTMLSRARMYTSERYHAVMAILSAVTFFASSFFLVSLHVPFVLIAAYMFATVSGNLQGKRLSERIEKLIGAVVNLGEMTKQKHPLSAKEVGIGLALFAAIEGFIFWKFGTSLSIQTLAILFVVSLVNSMFAGALTVARSTEKYWHNLILVSLVMISSFMAYKYMLVANGNWLAMLPGVAGGVLGSLLGVRVENKLNPKKKDSFDGHVINKVKKIETPLPQTAVAFLLLVAQFYLFGLTDHPAAFFLLFGVSCLESAGYTLSSRARTRQSETYIEWACTYSNGIWFAKAAIIVGSNVPLELLIVCVAASIIGSLWAQKIGMHIERWANAVTGATQEKTC